MRWTKLCVPWALAGLLCALGRADEPVVLRGHSREVAAVAFSPDGSLLASGGSDSIVRLWSVAGGQLTTSFPGHGGTINGVAFSPDGKLLASCEQYKLLKLWDLAASKELASTTAHDGSISSVSFAPDGKLLATTSRDHAVKLWSVPDLGAKGTLAGHRWDGFGVVWLAGGSSLASANGGGYVHVWDVATGERTQGFGEQGEQLFALAGSPDGKLLAGGGQSSLRLWSLESGKQEQRLTGFQANAVAFTPDGLTVVVGTQDGPVLLVEAATGAVRTTLKAHERPVWGVAVSPDGSRLATCSMDSTVRLWKMP